MGIRGGIEQSQNVVNRTFTANAQASGNFWPKTDARTAQAGWFNVSMKATAFTGTLTLQRSFDEGTTWSDVYDEHGNAVVATNVTNYSRRLREFERGVAYRWASTAWTSGTAVTARISQ